MSVKNQWTGVGRICEDLELRVTESGKKVLNFTVAVDESTKDKQYTAFIPAEAWEKTAEVISKYFKKGDQIIIGGRLVVRKYDDRGEPRKKIGVAVESFEFGQKKKEEKKEEKEYMPPEPTPQRQEVIEEQQELPFY